LFPLFGPTSRAAASFQHLLAPEKSGAGTPNAGARFEIPANCMSADNRYFVFSSHSTNLGATVFNVVENIYLRDRLLGTNILISADSNGNGGADSFCEFPTISLSGRYIAYASGAKNLGPGNEFSPSRVFVEDLMTQTVVGVPPEEWLFGSSPIISPDERYIAWLGQKGPGLKTLNLYDIEQKKSAFITDWTEQNTYPLYHFSEDGKYLVFYTKAPYSGLAIDTNGLADVIVYDTQSGSNELISTSLDGTKSGMGGDSSIPRISADGRYVLFMSDATNLVVGDTNNATDIFRRDRWTQTTELVNVSRTGGFSAQAARIFAYNSSPMTLDGRFIVFESRATDLVEGVLDLNGDTDIFVRDMLLGRTIPVSVVKDGTRMGFAISTLPTISPDGRYVLFNSIGLENSEPITLGNGFSWFVRDIFAGITRRLDLGGMPLKEFHWRYGPGMDFNRDSKYLLVVCANSVASPSVVDTNSAADCLLLPAFPTTIVEANYGASSALFTLKTIPGLKHQLQSSSAMFGWTDVGDLLTATNEMIEVRTPFDPKINQYFRFSTFY
jgi:Tol biopolymer transport system component